MKPAFCIGIDPGLSGALGVLDAGGAFVAVHDMPTAISTTGRKHLDPAGLAAIPAPVP